MSTEIKNLLPIGTVVALHDAEKRLMIFGIKQIDTSENIEYDYVGVIYPEGNMGQNMQFLFNHDDIETVFYLGYDDIERQVFISQLTQVLEKTEEMK